MAFAVDRCPDKIERMGLPRVILIGGAPRSGKGTVARRLALHLDYDLVCIDDLGAAARSVTTKETHPELHPMAGYDYREYYVARTSDQLWDDATRAHEALFPAIAAVVRARASWARPAVVEGWALLPHVVERARFGPEVAALWLLVDGATLDERIRASPTFYRGASDETRLLARFNERSLRYNSAIEGADNVTVLRVTQGETPEALVNRILIAVRRPE
jgi:2-phosphoglycerate kinase